MIYSPTKIYLNDYKEYIPDNIPRVIDYSCGYDNRYVNSIIHRYNLHVKFNDYCKFDGNKITINVQKTINDINSNKNNYNINLENCNIWYISEKFSVCYDEKFMTDIFWIEMSDKTVSIDEYIIKNLLE